MLPPIKRFTHLILDSTATGVKAYIPANKTIRVLNIVAWATKTEATDAIVKLQLQSAPGVTSGATDLATLTFGAANNQGKQLNSDLNGSEVDAGECLAINLTDASVADKGIVVDVYYIENEALLEELGQAAS